jgi:large subunit ribosomal protein L23
MISDPRQIIKTHIATERSTALREKNNEYVFMVDKDATKYTIKQAVEEAFRVKVASVRTLVVPGKVRRMGRFVGKTPTWKKAIVRLKPGQRIAIFENI